METSNANRIRHLITAMIDAITSGAPDLMRSASVGLEHFMEEHDDQYSELGCAEPIQASQADNWAARAAEAIISEIAPDRSGCNLIQVMSSVAYWKFALDCASRGLYFDDYKSIAISRKVSPILSHSGYLLVNDLFNQAVLLDTCPDETSPEYEGVSYVFPYVSPQPIIDRMNEMINNASTNGAYEHAQGIQDCLDDLLERGMLLDLEQSGGLVDPTEKEYSPIEFTAKVPEPEPEPETGTNLPELRNGYQRAFVQCKKCGHPGFYDFLPYSLSNPVLVLPCGHSPYREYAREVSEDQFHAACADFVTVDK